jgi:hypothetical protein
MGDWGPEPWESDEAADWFHKLWRKCDFSVLIDEIRNFDEREEGYDSFRAASYVLQCLGNPYMWPSKHLDILTELLDKSISVLENMINPPNDAWVFLEMGNDARVVDSVRSQITELRKRRSAIVT